MIRTARLRESYHVTFAKKNKKIECSIPNAKGCTKYLLLRQILQKAVSMATLPMKDFVKCKGHQELNLKPGVPGGGRSSTALKYFLIMH